jgi:hypothetical protein
MYLVEGPNHTPTSKVLAKRASMTFVVHRTVGVEGVDATHHCKSRQKVGGGDDDIHDVVLLDEGEGGCTCPKSMVRMQGTMVVVGLDASDEELKPLDKDQVHIVGMQEVKHDI